MGVSERLARVPSCPVRWVKEAAAPVQADPSHRALVREEGVHHDCYRDSVPLCTANAAGGAARRPGPAARGVRATGGAPAVDSDEPTSLRSALITRVSGAKMFCWDGL